MPLGGALNLATPVAFTTSLSGPTSIVQNAYVQNNTFTDPSVSATLSFSRTGYNSAYTGSIGMQPSVGLQTKVNGVVVATVNPTNSLYTFPTTVQLSNPLQVNGVLATGSSPLVLQGADSTLTTDCVGLLKADTVRAHTLGGSVTVLDPISFGSATGSNVVANAVFVQNLSSTDAGVNSYTSYNRSGYNSALTASTGISPSRGGYVLNVNGRQVLLADTGVGNVTFAQGVIVQGGQTIAGGLNVTGATGLSTATLSGTLTANAGVTLPDALSNFTGKLSQIKNDGVAFNPNATADLYMNNYNIYTADSVNGTSGIFANAYVRNTSSADPTVKALISYDRSGYNTAFTASQGLDPAKGYVLNVNGRNIYTADVSVGNVGFSQGVAIAGNLTVSGGFNYVPTGTVHQYAGSSAPAGFLVCDGLAVSRSGYAALFAIISTTYGGGDGSSTFNIPNLKGRVAVGYNQSDRNFNTVGLPAGESSHTLSLSEMPSHSHGVSDPGHSHGLSDPGHYHTYSTYSKQGGQQGNNSQSATAPFDAYGTTAGTYYTPSPYQQANGTGITVNTGYTGISTGSSTAHNNLQPFLVMYYIIKV